MRGTGPVYVVLGSSETLVKPLLSKAEGCMVNEAADEQLNDAEVRAKLLTKAWSILVTEAGMAMDVRPDLPKA